MKYQVLFHQLPVQNRAIILKEATIVNLIKVSKKISNLKQGLQDVTVEDM